MENKLKVNVNMDGFIESISRQVDRLYEVSKILNGEDKKPSLKEQRIEVLKNFIANDLFDTTYNVEDVKVINFEVSSDDARYLRTDSSFEVDGKHIRCLSYDNSIIAMDNLERIKNYDGDVCSLIGLYHLKYLNNVVVIVRDLNQKAKKENVRVSLAMDYIKDILISFDERLLFIYFDEIPVELSRLDKADIVDILEEKYGYNCKADNNGFFIERYNYIRKELEDMIGIDNLCESSEIIWDDGNSIYGKSYYNELTEDSYSCFVYDNFDEFIDNVLGLTEGNFIRTKELEDGFRMIVVKNVPNIDMDDEE